MVRMAGWRIAIPGSNFRDPEQPTTVMELTKRKSKNNRRSFDSFHAKRETFLRMTILRESERECYPFMREKPRMKGAPGLYGGASESKRRLGVGGFLSFFDLLFPAGQGLVAGDEAGGAGEGEVIPDPGPQD
jgi:hypothetical protein